MAMDRSGPDTAVAAAACCYDLDNALNLVAVDAAWSDFAHANGAPRLAGSRIIGTSVLSYISDHTTAVVYKCLFDRVQERGETVQFPIRCDSPELRRFLEIEISRRPGGFRVRSSVKRSEPRRPQELLEPERPDDGTLLHMCSWCKRVDALGAWVEVEEAVRRLALFEHAVLPKITHTMCEPCYADVIRLVDR